MAFAQSPENLWTLKASLRFFKVMLTLKARIILRTLKRAMVALVQDAKKEKFVGFFADEATKRKLKERAGETQRGNVSAHLRELALADIDGDSQAPKIYEADIIDRLAKIYGGYFAPKLAKALAEYPKADQPAILHDLLAQLMDCIASGSAPGQNILVPRWELRPDHPGYMPQPTALMAAESAAPYGVPRRAANSGR